MAQSPGPTWLQNALQVLATGVILAAILGGIATRDTVNKDSVRLDNYYIVLGQTQTTQMKIAESLAVVATAQATIMYRLEKNEENYKQLSKQMMSIGQK